MPVGSAKRRPALDLVERMRDYFSPRERIDTSPKVSDAVKYTTCYMCACRCGIKVHLKDGGIRYIEGNRDHPVNRGVLCGKGSAGIMQHYSPARLHQAAAARRARAAAGEFREIEWDEALAHRARMARRDPRRAIRSKLAFFTGRDQRQALTGWWASQFGTPNYRRAWRVLLGQHGGGRHLHDRRLVLGIRRARLGAHANTS